MESASRLWRETLRIIICAANAIALLALLGVRNLAQSEPIKSPTVNKQTTLVRLILPGWSEEEPGDGLRYWRDPDGDVLSLGVLPKEQVYPFTSDETEQRKWSRKLAEGRDAGLIEVRAMPSKIAPSASVIYKRLKKPAYTYTGSLFTWVHGATVVWTIVAGERGTTGVREAAVAADLINSGKLTLDGYKQSWAQDPYEPAYHGVDRSALRFMSDDESYDAQFPKHPLSKVRRVLAALPDHVQYDFPNTSLGLVVKQSACSPTSSSGFTKDCWVNAYTVVDGKHTEWRLFCGGKKDEMNVCGELVAHSIWPFDYVEDSKYCIARTLKGEDGKDYPVNCVSLSVGTGKPELIYSIMKYGDFRCTGGTQFCKK